MIHGWARILILGQAGVSKQEFSRLARKCRKFEGEDFVIRKEYKEKFKGARVSRSQSVKKVEEVGVSSEAGVSNFPVS